DVADFLIQKLSPEELSAGLIPDPDQALVFVQRHIENAHQRSSTAVTNEMVNRNMLRELVPSRNLDELLERFSTRHLRIALPEDFMPTGAYSAPAWCRNCVFYSICEPGRLAVREYYSKSKQR
ncbi:MAG: hypothetical protein KDD62_12635, partial [Bdellovibrionales bacterium]|nr:hypothetical protein [Bdellovibrionales bacterium]